MHCTTANMICRENSAVEKHVQYKPGSYADRISQHPRTSQIFTFHIHISNRLRKRTNPSSRYRIVSAKILMQAGFAVKASVGRQIAVTLPLKSTVRHRSMSNIAFGSSLTANLYTGFYLKAKILAGDERDILEIYVLTLFIIFAKDPCHCSLLC